MATYAMQSLGCDVAALNTVHFSMFDRLIRDHPCLHVDDRCIHTAQGLNLFHLNSRLIQTGNHTGYRQFKGTRATAQEITDLYQGLCQSNLTDFDVMLSGYAPSAAAVEAVGAIGMDLKKKKAEKPGSFFWGV